MGGNVKGPKWIRKARNRSGQGPISRRPGRARAPRRRQHYAEPAGPAARWSLVDKGDGICPVQVAGPAGNLGATCLAGEGRKLNNT